MKRRFGKEWKIYAKNTRFLIGFKYEKLLFFAGLFVLLGLGMDFIHEFGHAGWGIAVGGRLTYIQVAYFEIYPQLAVVSEFVLGRVEVQGLTGFNYGLFLISGSMTTNIVSWLLVIVLLVKPRFKMRLGLRILGFFGLLDLPLYVVLPQIGLQHWVFVGGNSPEPLRGARMMNIPDGVFYLIVFFTTLGLVHLYFGPFIRKAWNRTRSLLRLNEKE